MSDLLFENHGWYNRDDDPDAPIPYTLPSRVPTQPDIHVEPETLPMIPVSLEASRCYFCGDPPHDDVHGIPMCEECQHRYGRDK